VTAKYANHAKKEANWGFASRIWRISRLSLFASCRRPLWNLCAPVVKIRAKQSQFTQRSRGQSYQQSQFDRTGPGERRARSGCTNKPNSHPPDRQAGPRREPVVTNKPNSAPSRRGSPYKQTQFAGVNHATSPRCPASGNKANFREPARPGGRLYKQTQFLPLCRSGDRRSREGDHVKQGKTRAS
jgi:hypothetical protein